MKHRIFGVLLCVVMLLALVGCTQQSEPEVEPETLPETIEPEEMPEVDPIVPDLEFEEEMTDADYHGLPDDTVFFETTGTHNPEIVAAFTPADAYVHTDVESFLVLTSQMSMMELIDVVFAGANELGATLYAIEEPFPDTWVYIGTLPNGNPIQVTVRDDGELGVNLMVEY